MSEEEAVRRANVGVGAPEGEATKPGLAGDAPPSGDADDCGDLDAFLRPRLRMFTLHEHPHAVPPRRACEITGGRVG